MFWILLVFCGGGAVVANKTGCDLVSPPQTRSVDSNYKLGVAGDPDLFLPGELYTVSLQGVDNGEGPTPFSGFTIWAELAPTSADFETTVPSSTTKLPPVGNMSLGSFQTYDAQSKMLEVCEPAVMNATAHSKTEIQVIWNAPKGIEDVCVRLCARAGPATENTASWSVLARTLCPAPTASAGSNKQPPIVEPCCACDEAKYEVTFEGLWSRFTHPRLFPPESYKAHFGDIIGASHTAQYRVWQEGRVASPGVRRLAEDGTTTDLEKELKAESDHIRTIIKARGISWQHIGTTGNTASTFAVFRVDARNHLVSLATKLAPSPDWIVGVSALELCNANCTWRNTATISLYPYDAGMDNGITYTSPREPTIPSGAVRALRPDWPRDPRSPFFNVNMEMRPFARLKLNRLRLYEKNCGITESSPKRSEISKPEVPGRVGACLTSEWGPWGACSVTCGPGKSARQRRYVRPLRARADSCRVPLTEYKLCHGPRMHCRAKSQYEPVPWSDSGPCALSPWSEWSACEGCGIRARVRNYISPRALKRCHVGHRERTSLHEAIPCDAGPCHRPLNRKYLNDTGFDWYFVDKPSEECRVSDWGWWSPCSHECGMGRRLRTRLFIHPDTRVRRILTESLIFKWNQMFAQWQGVEIGEVNYTSTEPEVQTLIDRHDEACAIVLTQEEASCEGEKGHCKRQSANEVCGLPMLVGPCRGYVERWFYDTDKGICEPFGYTGCGGNDNNFKTHAICEQFCANYTHEVIQANNISTIAPNITTTARSISTTASNNSTRAPNTTTEAKKNITKPHSKDNDVMLSDAPVNGGITEDCEMTPWHGWGECFGDCSHAIKLNYRNILRNASESGRQCPLNLIRVRNCVPTLCKPLLLAEFSTERDDT